ncbi:MAG: adenylate/guanylate cyclase domain-containing protein, partial [Boseongicola sp.]
GDGVNIAARLESLAEPGGIYLSAKVHAEVMTKLDLAFDDLGLKEVKNIAEPIHVYRVAVERPNCTAPSPETEALSRPDKPSIAVLPFTNMSGDPEQEYFSDGITEDIITELSRFSEIFVIARNSSFVFKGQAVDIKDAARKLGVQYVLEGSVRKAGKRVRVTAQLIDAVAGSHLWADRYDRQLEDIFDVQDDVVRAIVAILPGRIAAAGAEWSRRKPTNNLTAFDYLLRGNHALVRRGGNISDAIRNFRKALEIDPECAAAFSGIAIAEGMSVWDLSTYSDDPLGRAYEAGKRALELDPSDYRSHVAFGEALRQLGEHALARQHLQRAMSLNPNSAQVL